VLSALRGTTEATSTRNVIDQIIAVRGPEPPWWDWGSERPTIADLILAIQQGQASDTDESVWDIVDSILGAAGIAEDVAALIAKTGGDALLAVLLAVAVGQRLSLANIEVNSITTKNLLGELQKTLTGSTSASSDNLMEVLRGTTPRPDYDAANILAVLESMDTYLS
jgi:hypothetical protein